MKLFVIEIREKFTGIMRREKKERWKRSILAVENNVYPNPLPFP